MTWALMSHMHSLTRMCRVHFCYHCFTHAHAIAATNIVSPEVQYSFSRNSEVQPRPYDQQKPPYKRSVSQRSMSILEESVWSMCI